MAVFIRVLTSANICDGPTTTYHSRANLKISIRSFSRCVRLFIELLNVEENDFEYLKDRYDVDFNAISMHYRSPYFNQFQ